MHNRLFLLFAISVRISIGFTPSVTSIPLVCRVPRKLECVAAIQHVVSLMKQDPSVSHPKTIINSLAIPGVAQECVHQYVPVLFQSVVIPGSILRSLQSLLATPGHPAISPFDIVSPQGGIPLACQVHVWAFFVLSGYADSRSPLYSLFTGANDLYVPRQDLRDNILDFQLALLENSMIAQTPVCPVDQLISQDRVVIAPGCYYGWRESECDSTMIDMMMFLKDTGQVVYNVTEILNVFSISEHLRPCMLPKLKLLVRSIHITEVSLAMMEGILSSGQRVTIETVAVGQIAHPDKYRPNKCQLLVLAAAMFGRDAVIDHRKRLVSRRQKAYVLYALPVEVRNRILDFEIQRVRIAVPLEVLTSRKRLRTFERQNSIESRISEATTSDFSDQIFDAARDLPPAGHPLWDNLMEATV